MMNKKSFWNLIKDCFSKAENKMLSIAFNSLCYEDKTSGDIIDIEYKELGIDFDTLLELLKELEKENYIELIDTNNMGYFIYQKDT